MERVGYLCTYVPVELVEAAGFHPMRVIPRSSEKDEVLLDPNICPYLKAVLSQLQRESPKGLVFINSCDGMRRLYDAVRWFFPSLEVCILDVPRSSDERGVLYYREVIEDFSRWLGNLRGKPLLEEEVREAIARCNQRRRALFEILKERPRAGDLLRALKGGFPPKDLQEVRLREGEGRVKVLVTGSLLEADGILDWLEELGGEVLIPDVCSGLRGAGYVGGGEPFLALAKAYLEKPPCARMRGSRRRLLREAVKEVQAVLAYIPKFCDHYLYELATLRGICKEEGRPLLHLEGEYTVGVSEGIRTRVQAFLERWR